jgi:hypothetical protein
MSAARWMLSALVLVAPCVGCAQQTLDEAAVRKVLAEVDRAAAERNADGVARHVSESAKLTVEMTTNGQPQSVSMNKSQYVDAMRQTWAAVEDYEFQRLNVRITIAGARATVTSTLLESITMQGQTLRTTTEDTSVLELVSGRPQLVSSIGKLQM